MKKHLTMQWEYLRIAFKTALEYRTNFIIQVSSMVVNDIVWALFWMMFFSKFRVVSGWTINDMLTLYSVLTLSFGIAGLVAGNRTKIADIIVTGKLDYYLTLPKNILHHMLISKASWYDLGDILFGLVLMIIAVPPIKIPLLILFTIIGATIMIMFSIIIGSLAFYFGNAEHLSTTFNDGMIALSSYPTTIYQGVVRILVFTVLPAGFIVGVPVQLLQKFDWTIFAYTLGYTLIITIVAITIFYKGLKKYESGNMMNVRM